MSKLDKNLIFLYSENARAKINDISKKLKKSPQRLKYNIKILEKSKIIMSPHCLFDYSHFGIIVFRVYFKGGYISDKDKSEILKKLSENKYVTSIYELGGEFDLVIEVSSPNPSRFNKELKNIITLIPALNNYKIILNIVTHNYPRNYLPSSDVAKPYEENDVIIGGDREVAIFGKNEIRVMKGLLSNSKMHLTKLARQSGINVKTARFLLKKMKNMKIIRGFHFIINTTDLGINSFRLFLKLHNMSKEREDELMGYMLKTKEIIQVNKTVGDWDLEVDIESFDNMKIRVLVKKLREEFKDIIQSFNMMEFYQYHKKTYLPEYLFEEY